MADIDLASIETVDGLDVKGKRVLVRADLNVPVEAGAVADATRIERVLPTIEALRKNGAKVVLLSHFGRPKGERSPDTSLRPVAVKLEELLGAKVLFLDDCHKIFELSKKQGTPRSKQGGGSSKSARRERRLRVGLPRLG